MRKLVPIILYCTLFYSCSNKGKVSAFGTPADTLNFVRLENFSNQLSNKTNQPVTVFGRIKSVCLAEGCWMKLGDSSEKELLIRMKNEEFAVTEDIIGKYAYVNGVVKYDTLSIEKLKAEAIMNGVDSSQAADITNPEIKLFVEAEGILAR